MAVSFFGRPTPNNPPPPAFAVCYSACRAHAAPSSDVQATDDDKLPEIIEGV